MSTLMQVRDIVGEVLQLGDRTLQLSAESPLLGSIPEFDSMAVVSVITTIEEHFGFIVDDDEIGAETFATLGSLSTFVDEKLS